MGATGSLSQPGVSAVRWSLLSSGARFGLQLVAQVLLARLLGPEVFGVFAIGLVLLTFANFISGFGFSWSLLQRQQLREEDIRFAWTWQMLAGLAAGALLLGLAPWLAQVFRSPQAEDVIRWLSLACVLQAAAAPSTYLLQRALDFRAVGLVQLGSYTVGYIGVGLPMAWQGAGVHALVAAWLVQSAVALAASHALAPHPLKPLLWYPAAGQVMRTGRAVFLTNLVNWGLNNLDRLLIARLLNPSALGLYNVAYNLATVPNQLLLGALQPAFMAAGARLQDERPRLSGAYLQIVATLLVLGVPAFAVCALLSPDLVALLYGRAWEGSGAVLALLFAFMPAYVVWGVSTPVLWNTGRPQHEWALQLPLLGLGALGLWWAAAHGIVAMALACGGLLLARAAVMVAAALRALGLSGWALAPHALRGALLTATATGAVMCGQALADALASRPDAVLARLALGAAVPLLLAGSALARPAWAPALLGEPCWHMVLRFAPRLAGRPAQPSPWPPGPHTP